MSKPRIIITIKQSKSKEERAQINAILDKTRHTGTLSSIPLPYNSISPCLYMPCAMTPSDYKYGRSGIIPFTRIGEEIILFLVLFKGYDRDMKVIELSDFGGRSKKSEDFITTACYEAFEESLGIFNFLGQESVVCRNSYVSQATDRSTSVIAAPVKLTVSPAELASRYDFIRRAMNGPPEAATEASSFKFGDLNDVDRGHNLASLVDKFPSSEAKETSHPFNRRSFNSNEIANIVYITLTDVKAILEGKKVAMPNLLCLATSFRYTEYPPIYFAVSKHLPNLIPFMEQYRVG